MADKIFSSASSFNFTLTPEPRQASLTPGNFTEIGIMATNKSGRPVRVHPFLIPIENNLTYPGSGPFPPHAWISWLSLPEEDSLEPKESLQPEERPELVFAPEGVHCFKARISPPLSAPLGSYSCKLVLSGVENPDEERAESVPIKFNVTGAKVDVSAFAISSAVILALVILAIIAVVVLVNRPSLKISLAAPSKVIEGETVQYRLSVANSGSGPVRNVIVMYNLLPNMVGATAFVTEKTADPVPSKNRRYCNMLENSIRCDLGTLTKGESIEVAFLAVPGPAARLIDNRKGFEVSGQVDEGREAYIFPIKFNTDTTSVQALSAQDNKKPFAIALVPSTSTPLIGEDFTYQVLAWGTGQMPEAGLPDFTFTFTLPAGMRYVDSSENLLKKGCKQSDKDYFDILCTSKLPYPTANAGIARIGLKARAAGPADAPARLSKISLVSDSKEASATTAATVTTDTLATMDTTATTATLNTALYFDGIDDWAQLGYQQALQTFTIEMWVNPFSGDDGQSFAGLHRKEPDGTVSNVFLVGYWFGSLHVNVNGVSHNLVTPKRTDRYHLAVVVEKDPANGKRSKVSVYVNGEVQDWEEVDEDCEHCKYFASVMPGGENPLPWVLGQDWDTGSTSDFFHGTLSEVRFWSVPRSKDEIQATYKPCPPEDEDCLVAYYRLEPLDPNSDALASQVASVPPGKRIGAAWVEAAPRYSGALQFNGYNQALAIPGLQLTSTDQDGYVNLTLSGRIMVGEIPSRQAWILGSAVSSGSSLNTPPAADLQVNMAESLVTQERAALESAQKELEAAEQAYKGLNLDPVKIMADSKTARRWLYLLLDTWNNLDGTNLKCSRQETGFTIEATNDFVGKDIEQLISQFHDEANKAQADRPLAALCYLALVDAELASNSGKAVNFQDLSTAQTALDSALVQLETWQKSEIQESIETCTGDWIVGFLYHLPRCFSPKFDPNKFILMDEIKNTLNRYQEDQSNLRAIQASRGRVDAAQERVNLAQAREDEVLKSIQALKDAQHSLDEAKAGADLEKVLLDQYSNLQGALEKQMARESALKGLEDILLKQVVDQAVDKGYASVQENTIGCWTVPYLDFPLDNVTSLGSQAMGVIRSAAETGALEILKPKVEPNQRANPSDSNSNQTRSQKMIDQFSRYLDSLNQSEGEGASNISQSSAKALAESIADRVAFETIQYLANPETCLSTSDSPSVEQIKTAVKADVANTLETIRWTARIRLYYQVDYAINHLDYELAAGLLSDEERLKKVTLRNHLANVNEVLDRLLETSGSLSTSADMDQVLQKALKEAADTLKTVTAQGSTYFADSTPASTGPQGSNLWAGLLVDSDGHVMLAARPASGGDWFSLKDEKPLQPGQWIHYTAVLRYNAQTGEIARDKEHQPLLYRDGNLVKGMNNSASLTIDMGNIQCPTGLYVGGLSCGTDGGLFFAGRIDEVRIWNRWLKKEEINTWRNLPGAYFDEKAYLSFDDGPGNSTGYVKSKVLFKLPLNGPGWVDADAGLQEISLRP